MGGGWMDGWVRAGGNAGPVAAAAGEGARQALRLLRVPGTATVNVL